MVVFPILTVEPSRSEVWAIRCPSTSMPLVEPRSCTDGAGPRRRCRYLHVELDVATAHAGVVDAQVGLGAAADDQPRWLERVPGAVDLEEGARAADLGVGGLAGDAGLGPAADPEPSGGQVLGGLEGDATGPGKT